MRAIERQEPDRIPLDLGSHRDSSIVLPGYENLKKYLGIESESKIASKMTQAVVVDEHILDELDIDTRGVYPGAPDGGNDRTLPDGTWIDHWGVEWHKPEGVPYYELKRSPLAGEITVADIVSYPWPNLEGDPGITRGLREEVRHWRETTDCAIVVNMPAPVVHVSQFLRGFEDWYMDVVADPKLFEALLDACLEVNTSVLVEVLNAVGSDVDVIMTSDDIGTQIGMQCSPRHYRKYIKPRHARFFDIIHSATDAKLMFHTCGSVRPIIGDLIDIGVDVLNPVQPRAADMDPGELKREFGHCVSFWGGIDIQETLPFGSVTDVYAEVRQRFEELGQGGGWVLCPAHNIQPDVPPENIVALYRAGKEVGRYS